MANVYTVRPAFRAVVAEVCRGRVGAAGVFTRVCSSSSRLFGVWSPTRPHQVPRGRKSSGNNCISTPTTTTTPRPLRHICDRSALTNWSARRAPACSTLELGNSTDILCVFDLFSFYSVWFICWLIIRRQHYIRPFVTQSILWLRHSNFVNPDIYVTGSK